MACRPARSSNATLRSRKVSAATLWLGRNIELGLGDAEQAARYAQRLKDEFPTSEEASLLYDAERAQP